MQATAGKALFKAGEEPHFSRLKFISTAVNVSNLINESNRKTRDIVFRESMEEFCWQPLNDIIHPGAEDILISEFDRYGLPLRTVLSRKTGLMRTDPFYTSEYLNKFYVRYYRDLYSNGTTTPRELVLKEQIERGSGYFKLVQAHLKQNAKVLEIGCGMGGILIPFKLAGMNITGIDLGNEFIELGNNLGLNLYVKSVDDLINAPEKYDLIILSHVIEHIPDLNEFLSKVWALLTPAGKVFISVPGIRNIHNMYGSDILTYLQNAHCWSFTAKTLSAVLAQNNFEAAYIDEEINCIAGRSKGVTTRVDVSGETDSVVRYLDDVERQFNRRKNSNTFLRKVFRSLVYRSEKLFFGKQ